jgi:hypothetical protein
MSSQYLRKVGLVVATGSQGLDLSNMQMQFATQQADQTAPNTAYIRVFNLKDSTAKAIQNEFQTVSLQAGYENGNYAQIFNGQIMQVKRGRIDAVTKYLDIMASDGDLFHHFGFINNTLAAGNTSAANQYAAIQGVATGTGVNEHPNNASALAATGGVLPRGKVQFGLARYQLDKLTASKAMSWYIKDGQLILKPLTGYLPGEAVVLTSKTGMIGIPEATNQGIELRCLLNPLISVGTQVKLDNKSINQTTQRQFGGLYPGWTDINFFASTADDGVYQTIVVEHFGDIRGNQWESHLTCLALDKSSGAGSSIRAY